MVIFKISYAPLAIGSGRTLNIRSILTNYGIGLTFVIALNIFLTLNSKWRDSGAILTFSFVGLFRLIKHNIKFTLWRGSNSFIYI